MPSPIAHSALVLIVRAFNAKVPAMRKVLEERCAAFYAAVLLMLCLPDVDFLLRELVDHQALVHGGATHSLFAGLVFGILFGVGCRWGYGPKLPLRYPVAIGIGCAWSHSLLDMATFGRGVMLFWPFTFDRYTAIPLFYGARHSQPAAWELHMITFITEFLFAMILWILMRGFWRNPEQGKECGDGVTGRSRENGTATKY